MKRELLTRVKADRALEDVETIWILSPHLNHPDVAVVTKQSQQETFLRKLR